MNVNIEEKLREERRNAANAGAMVFFGGPQDGYKPRKHIEAWAAERFGVLESGLERIITEITGGRSALNDRLSQRENSRAKAHTTLRESLARSTSYRIACVAVAVAALLGASMAGVDSPRKWFQVALACALFLLVMRPLGYILHWAISVRPAVWQRCRLAWLDLRLARLRWRKELVATWIDAQTADLERVFEDNKSLALQARGEK